MSNNNRSHTNPVHITFLTDQSKTDHQEAVQNALDTIQSKGNNETLSSIQQVGMYAYNGANFERLLCDTDGHLKVDVVSMTGGGDASASNQTTMIGHLSTIEGDTTSLDSKITACDTTGKATLSEQQSQTTHLSTIAGDTTSLDGKVVACDTTGKATLSEQQSQTTHLSTIAGDTTSLDGKVVACDTTGKATLSEQQSQTTHLSTIAGDTTSLDAKVPSQGQAVMTGSLPVVIASNQSTLDVKQKSSENLGSLNNLANGVSITAGSNSSAVDVSNMREANIIYEDTNTGSSDGLEVDVSVDNGSTFHEAFSTLFPTNNSAGSKRVASITNLNLAGITNIRLRNNSGSTTYTNVKSSVVGCP